MCPHPYLSSLHTPSFPLVAATVTVPQVWMVHTTSCLMFPQHHPATPYARLTHTVNITAITTAWTALTTGTATYQQGVQDTLRGGQVPGSVGLRYVDTKSLTVQIYKTTQVTHSSEQQSDKVTILNYFH